MAIGTRKNILSTVRFAILEKIRYGRREQPRYSFAVLCRFETRDAVISRPFTPFSCTASDPFSAYSDGGYSRGGWAKIEGRGEESSRILPYFLDVKV